VGRYCGEDYDYSTPCYPGEHNWATNGTCWKPGCGARRPSSDRRAQVDLVAQVLHGERHGEDGFSCPAGGVAPHPKDVALAERIVSSLVSASHASRDDASVGGAL
jgi:hypothetical protein